MPTNLTSLMGADLFIGKLIGHAAAVTQIRFKNLHDFSIQF
jgi:hypothetical protein